MADQQAKFVLTLEGKDDQLTSLFAAFKRQVRSDVSEIERITSNVQLFSTLDADLKKAATSVDFTRAAVASLGRTIESLRGAGEPVGKDLEKAFAAAQRAANAAQKEFIAQSQALGKLREQLTAAGVDTTNLAAAELKLAAAAKAAAAAAAEQAAKQATGFKTLRDIAPEVQKVRDGYNALAASGKLSFGELSTLHARASQQINALNAGVTGLSEAFRAVRGTVLGFAVAFAGVGVAIAASTKNFLAFSTQIAAIDTIADVSKGRIAELSAGVSQLSRTMGVDAVDAAKALYDIIGSGIPADNALQVLALSTQAARAGLTDVSTAAKAGVAVLNGFGLQANQLEHVLDVMFQTVRDGVITFKEIGDNIGNVIPIARAAGVSVEEVGAAFATLTAKSGINAPEAATSIARAIQDLAAPAPEAAAKMRELGISFQGLLGTVEQFSKLNLSLDEISKIIPDIRAAKGVLALAQNFKFLNEEVTAATKTAGQMKAAYDIMAATPQFQIDRLSQSFADLSRTIGKVIIEAALPFIKALADMLEAFNRLSPSTKETTTQIIAFSAAVGAAVLVVRTLAIPINLLVGALATIGPLTGGLASGLTAASIAMRALGAAAAFFVGFKIGAYLSDTFEIVRRFGDVLGIVLAAFVTLGQYVGNVFLALFSGSFFTTLSSLTDKLLIAAQVLKGEFVDALFGTTRAADEASRASTALRDRLVELGTAASTAVAKVTEAVSGILAKLGTELAQVETRIKTTTTSLSALVADLEAQVGKIASNAGTALATLAAQTAQALNSLQSIDSQKILDTVEIQRKAATERFAILKKFAEDSLAAFQKEADARLAIAQKSKLNLKQVEQDILEDKRAKLQDIVDKTRAHYDTLLEIQRASLEKIRDLEAKRRDISADIDAQIRELRRKNLTEYQAYADRVREIDELLAKARLAAAQGQDKLAEQFATKAVGLVNGISTAVKEEGEEVVTQSRATSTATDRLIEAKKILLGVNEKNLIAEKAQAQAATDGLKDAKTLLDQITPQLEEVRKKIAEGIKLKIEADVTGVEKELVQLEKDVAKREVLVPLIGNLEKIDAAIEAKRKDLEKGIPVTLTAETKELTDAIKKVEDARPELKVLTDAALGKVGDLRAKLEALSEVATQSQHTVTSNVDDVQKQIDTLKAPTESTHTVHVVIDNPTGVPIPGAGGGGSSPEPSPGFARGGLVPQRRRRYARGGLVFNEGGKVPGTGAGDTVRATLQAGQFVVRKAASRYYGDGVMGAIARFATGGPVIPTPIGKTTGAVTIGGHGRANLGPGSDANYQETIDKLYNLREKSQSLPHSSTGLDFSLWAAKVIERFPFFDDKRKEKVKNVVEEGNDGWLESFEAARKFRVPAVVDYTLIPLAYRRGGLIPMLQAIAKMAHGGVARGTDTVRAMLTPGEHVMSRGAVAKFGTGFMDAVNRMSVPREALARMIAPPSAPVRYFEDGGQVGAPLTISRSGDGGGGGGASSSGGGGGDRSLTFNLNASAADILTPKNILNYIVPVIRDVERKSR